MLCSSKGRVFRQLIAEPDVSLTIRRCDKGDLIVQAVICVHIIGHRRDVLRIGLSIRRDFLGKYAVTVAGVRCRGRNFTAALDQFCIVVEGPCLPLRDAAEILVGGDVGQHHTGHTHRGLIRGIHRNAHLHNRGSPISGKHHTAICIIVGDTAQIALCLSLSIAQRCAIGQIQGHAAFQCSLQLCCIGIMRSAFHRLACAVGGCANGIPQLELLCTCCIGRFNGPVGFSLFIVPDMGLGQAPFAYLHIHRSFCSELNFICSFPARDLCLIFDGAAGCRSCGFVSNGIGVCVTIHI